MAVGRAGREAGLILQTLRSTSSPDGRGQVFIREKTGARRAELIRGGDKCRDLVPGKGSHPASRSFPGSPVLDDMASKAPGQIGRLGEAPLSLCGDPTRHPRKAFPQPHPCSAWRRPRVSASPPYGPDTIGE